jgi:hypothetical protein
MTSASAANSPSSVATSRHGRHRRVAHLRERAHPVHRDARVERGDGAARARVQAQRVAGGAHDSMPAGDRRLPHRPVDLLSALDRGPICRTSPTTPTTVIRRRVAVERDAAPTGSAPPQYRRAALVDQHDRERSRRGRRRVNARPATSGMPSARRYAA